MQLLPFCFVGQCCRSILTRVCVRERVCLPLFPNESLIVIPAPWNFDQWEDSLLARDNFGPFRNFAVWKQTAPRIKSNIVIILIPVSE